MLPVAWEEERSTSGSSPNPAGGPRPWWPRPSKYEWSVRCGILPKCKWALQIDASAVLARRPERGHGTGRCAYSLAQRSNGPGRAFSTGPNVESNSAIGRAGKLGRRVDRGAAGAGPRGPGGVLARRD